MQQVTIRKTKVEDAEEHIKMHNQVWRSAYSNIFPEEVFLERESKTEQKIKDFDNNVVNVPGHISYVAEFNGKIVGMMNASLFSFYDHYKELNFADLEAIYILPEYQGLGISSKLKNIFVNWAKENGAKNYVIGVLEDNIKARKVYEKWGGKLDSYRQPFTCLGNDYSEVFYIYNL